MAGDEYASVGGGSLKLKGVKGSKVEKHRKKKSKRPVDDAASASTAAPRDPSDSAEPDPTLSGASPNPEGPSSPKTGSKPDAVDANVEPRPSTKTAAELRHEERRRKMLDERLKREGVKTHKERVEELNKYLSGLSEHNDMPKIGPG